MFESFIGKTYLAISLCWFAYTVRELWVFMKRREEVKRQILFFALLGVFWMLMGILQLTSFYFLLYVTFPILVIMVVVLAVSYDQMKELGRKRLRAAMEKEKDQESTSLVSFLKPKRLLAHLVQEWGVNRASRLYAIGLGVCLFLLLNLFFYLNPYIFFWDYIRSLWYGLLIGMVLLITVWSYIDTKRTIHRSLDA